MISVTYMYMSLLLECVPFVMAPEVSSSHSVSLLAVFLTFLGLSSSFLLVPITTNTHTQRKGGGTHTHNEIEAIDHKGRGDHGKLSHILWSALTLPLMN